MKRKKKPTPRPTRVLGLTPTAFIVLCFAVYNIPMVILRTEQSKMNYRLSKINHQYHVLRDENQDLIVTISELQSVSAISEAAKLAGLVATEKPVYAPSVSPKP